MQALKAEGAHDCIAQRLVQLGQLRHPDGAVAVEGTTSDGNENLLKDEVTSVPKEQDVQLGYITASFLSEPEFCHNMIFLKTSKGRTM